MKLDRKKFELARARACMGQKDFEKAGIPKGTLCRAMSGRTDNGKESIQRLCRGK